MASTPDPSVTSSAYVRMQDGWRMIEDILAGPDRIRSQGKLYLPKHEAEDITEYNRRLAQAPWQPEFEDILRSLASKPFNKEVGLRDGVSPKIRTIAEDVDTRGNNLTAFARDVFKSGIAKGVHGILVDYPPMDGVQNRRQEGAAGGRPYWVSIRAEDILALYTTFVNGREVVSHVRLREDAVRRDEFDEVVVRRVRVLEPGTWQLWEQVVSDDGKTTGWAMVGNGVTAPLTEVPLALFWTGEREGDQFVRPPLSALADKQIELYRALARQDDILTKAAYPMLTANGMAAPDEPVVVGPGRILYAPGAKDIQTSWDYIQPDASLITEVREGVKAVEEALRRLGMQPLTQQSGGVTATASSVEAAKAHTAVEAWALGLKDVLEQAFKFTSQWLGEDANVGVLISTDFIAGAPDQASLDALDKARARGDISRTTYLEGLQRFNVLPGDFVVVEEEQRLIDEMPGDDTVDGQVDAMGGDLGADSAA